MMRQRVFIPICAAALLLASAAGAALHDEHRPPPARHAREVAHGQLEKPLTPGMRLFSNVMLDPARCNYEYVELHGSTIVRTELRLTCTTHR